MKEDRQDVPKAGTECGSRSGLQSYKELTSAEFGKGGKEDSWISDRDGGLTHSKKTQFLTKLASGKRRLIKCCMLKTTA